MKIGIGNTVLLKLGSRIIIKVLGKTLFAKVGKYYGFYILGYFYRVGL